MPSGTNPLSRLRRQLSRRASPWQRGQVSSSFVNGRKKPPLSCKLFAFAKASPFRERWHGEAVTERVDFRDKPSQSPTATALPKGEPLAKRAGLVLIRQRQEEASVKLQTFRLCQSLSLSGEVARRSRDGEGFSRDEPLPSFRFAKCQLPRGKLSSSSVNGQKEPAPIPSLDKPALSCYDGIISNSRRFEQLACKTNGGKAR